jgi:hypothetical protein
MDSNGTRYHLLLGLQDWSICTDENGVPFSEAIDSDTNESLDTTVGLGWDKARSEVILQQQLVRFEAARLDNPPSIDDRRGAGRDRYGNWYWIEKSGVEIVVNSSGTGLTTHFWSSSDFVKTTEGPRDGEFGPTGAPPLPSALQLSGLSVTEDHFLVVGVLAPAGLLIFDLHAGGPPRQVLWPGAVSFAPFDMAPAPGGGVWILDHDNRRYWRLDRYMNVVNVAEAPTSVENEEDDGFRPESSGPDDSVRRKNQDQPVSLPVPSSIDASHPIAIEALPDGTVLILDSDESSSSSAITRYRFGAKLGDTIPLHEFELVGFDIAFVPDFVSRDGIVSDRLFIASTEGNQTFAFDIAQGAENTLQLDLTSEFYPMRLFGGKGIVAAGKQVYYDFGTGWIPLVEQRRPKYAEVGILQTPLDNPYPPLDGQEPDCVWHRLMMDAHIPPQTRIRVWSRAANDVEQLNYQEWYLEPLPHRRGEGSELPFVPASTGKDSGTWELLFQRAVGRYLQLRLELQGDGKSTPRLRSIRSYYPRFSYLKHYLPVVYRENQDSASFLDRFLANFEGTFTSIEDKVANVQVLCDPRSAPADALEWLAQWFGVFPESVRNSDTLNWLEGWFRVLQDPAWDETKRRLFLQNAMEFFQYRGTICGLLGALRLSLEDCADASIFEPSSSVGAQSIRIVEKFRSRRLPAAAIGDPTEVGIPHQTVATARWAPEQGGATLSKLYRQYMQTRFGARSDFPQVFPFPISNPGTQTDFIYQTLLSSADDQDTPEQAVVWSLWQAFLQLRYSSLKEFIDAYGLSITDFADAVLPEEIHSATVQSDDSRDFVRAYASAWEQFSKGTLGFIPSSSAEDEPMWQNFLQRRYADVHALNDQYKLSVATQYASFSDVKVPQDVPPDGSALTDWFQFESVILAGRDYAHHFSVLLPISGGSTLTVDEHQQRLELAARIVNFEKPAHTVFDVKFYWALFRVGSARLGSDTLLDVGSRALYMVSPMTLGRNFLLESYLAPGHPRNVRERRILGRDHIGS